MEEKIPKHYQGEWTYEYNRYEELYEILDGEDLVAMVVSEDVAQYICELHNGGYVAESPTSKELG